MGLVYTGNGYDIVQYLAAAWDATGAPTPRRKISRRMSTGYEPIPIAVSAA